MKKMMRVELLVEVEERLMDDEDKRGYTLCGTVEEYHEQVAAGEIEPIEDAPLTDYTPMQIAECLEVVAGDRDIFAGSDIWAQFNTVTVKKAEWVE